MKESQISKINQIIFISQFIYHKCFGQRTILRFSKEIKQQPYLHLICDMCKNKWIVCPEIAMNLYHHMGYFYQNTKALESMFSLKWMNFILHFVWNLFVENLLDIQYPLSTTGLDGVSWPHLICQHFITIKKMKLFAHLTIKVWPILTTAISKTLKLFNGFDWVRT